MVGKIATSADLAEYRSHARLLRRISQFRVKLGFGLHMGWAIEGAIGSEFKIDASYLSPNVIMASRLEDATKTYGVSILISNSLVDAMTDVVKNHLRMIDR